MRLGLQVVKRAVGNWAWRCARASQYGGHLSRRLTAELLRDCAGGAVGGCAYRPAGSLAGTWGDQRCVALSVRWHVDLLAGVMRCGLLGAIPATPDAVPLSMYLRLARRKARLDWDPIGART